MAMSYTSLTAAKGTSGSIATWVDYTRLDTPVIVDEAQALIWSVLRCREMMTEVSFSVSQNNSFIALPARFLDPIGRMFLSTINRDVRHKDPNFVQRARNYTESSGTLGTDPFTTVNGSTSVTVALAAHGFTQDSIFTTTGATAVGGVTIAGTFPIISVDTNTFVIDISILGSVPSSSTTGGGSAATYTCDNLTTGIPNWFGIWDERIHFDCAFSQAVLGKMQYYQSLPLLAASTNETNFLTNRYPQLLRTACMAAAADYMKDDVEYQKGLARLEAFVQRISIENDMMMRGMELDTETP